MRLDFSLAELQLQASRRDRDEQSLLNNNNHHVQATIGAHRPDHRLPRIQQAHTQSTFPGVQPMVRLQQKTSIPKRRVVFGGGTEMLEHAYSSRTVGAVGGHLAMAMPAVIGAWPLQRSILSGATTHLRSFSRFRTPSIFRWDTGAVHVSSMPHRFDLSFESATQLTLGRMVFCPSTFATFISRFPYLDYLPTPRLRRPWEHTVPGTRIKALLPALCVGCLGDRGRNESFTWHRYRPSRAAVPPDLSQWYLVL